MSDMNIEIVHRLSNRVRFRLNFDFGDTEVVGDYISKHKGIESIRFNKIIKTVLIYFNPTEIDFQELIIRLTVALSTQHKEQEFRLIKQHEKSSLTPLSIIAGAFVAGAFIKSFLPGSPKPMLGTGRGMGNRFGMTSLSPLHQATVGITSLAILEHGWHEVKKKGYFDPEILSVFYFAFSLSKRHLLGATLLAWLVTFGRHLGTSSMDQISINVTPIKKDRKITYYDVYICKKKKIEKFQDYVGSVFSHFVKGKNKTDKIIDGLHDVAINHGKVLEGLDGKPNGMILNVEK